MKPALVTFLLLASSFAPIAQEPARRFDVVSIKLSQPNAQNRLSRISPGRVELFNTTLKQLIASAYSRFPFDPREVVGGPAWIDSERFDIVATMERPPRFDQAGMLGELNGMLRALIEERFGVKAHNEQREGDVYTLTLARSDRKTGAGLRQVPDACAAALKELTGAAPLPRRRPSVQQRIDACRALHSAREDRDGFDMRRVGKEIESGESPERIPAVEQCSRVASQRRDVAGHIDQPGRPERENSRGGLA